MSQSASNTPTTIVNAGGNRQQVPLRDYLNARVAPFLKKAITESLGVEAEFPLQWLGECLIHQSILYEGNPDRTNIRERFLYKFDDPKPQSEATSATTHPEDPATQPQEQPEGRQEPSAPETTVTTAEPAAAPEVSVPQPTPEKDAQVTNGVHEEEKKPEEESVAARDVDTEMGGTS
ncbi:hypothetical protein ABEF95_017000 [Exophiala dermatitidis]